MLTENSVQNQNCSRKYFQEQHSSHQTANYCSHYLGSCAHSRHFAVAAATAATATAAAATAAAAAATATAAAATATARDRLRG